MNPISKFIPKEKLSKKKKLELNAKQRLSWGNVNPITRTTDNKKAYNRKRLKAEGYDNLRGSFYFVLS